MLIQEQFVEMSDEKIYQLCRKFGEQALYWRKKFIGLLPEVYRRKLYDKKGFGSIFEFAKKLAGLSEEQVRLTLNLEKKFADKSLLKQILVNGEVSINKLARIASVVTPKNQEFWAAQVKLLPQNALETLVRDERLAQDDVANRSGFFEPKNEVKSLRTHSNAKSNLEMSTQQNELKLDADVEQKLLQLQKRGIDINNLLREFFMQRENEIAQEKKEIVTSLKADRLSKSSRYIPAKIRNLLKKEYGDKCSIQTCLKPSMQKHHSQRFSLTQVHDPRYIAPFCREHHLIAHSIDIKFHRKRFVLR